MYIYRYPSHSKSQTHSHVHHAPQCPVLLLLWVGGVGGWSGWVWGGGRGKGGSPTRSPAPTSFLARERRWSVLALSDASRMAIQPAVDTGSRGKRKKEEIAGKARQLPVYSSTPPE